MVRHGNNSSYGYHAELELTKGGTIEYAVATTGNKRETFEIPEEGGLMVVDINSTDDGTIKIKRRQVQNKEVGKIVESSTEKVISTRYDLGERESEITLLKNQVGLLEKQIGERHEFS